MHKGANRALIEARQRQQQTRTATPGEPVDEVQQYLDTRYIAPYEAANRIFKYRIYGQSSHVEVLPVHLRGEQVVYFPPGSLEKALADIKRTKLEAYFSLNASLPRERRLRYPDVPLHYTWNSKERRRDPRLQLPHAEIITRMVQVSIREVERDASATLPPSKT